MLKGKYGQSAHLTSYSYLLSKPNFACWLTVNELPVSLIYYPGNFFLTNDFFFFLVPFFEVSRLKTLLDFSYPTFLRFIMSKVDCGTSVLMIAPTLMLIST